MLLFPKQGKRHGTTKDCRGYFEATECPNCRITMRWFRSELVRDPPEPTIAHLSSGLIVSALSKPIQISFLLRNSWVVALADLTWKRCTPVQPATWIGFCPAPRQRTCPYRLQRTSSWSSMRRQQSNSACIAEHSSASRGRSDRAKGYVHTWPISEVASHLTEGCS